MTKIILPVLSLLIFADAFAFDSKIMNSYFEEKVEKHDQSGRLVGIGEVFDFSPHDVRILRAKAVFLYAEWERVEDKDRKQMIGELCELGRKIQVDAERALGFLGIYSAYLTAHGLTDSQTQLAVTITKLKSFSQSSGSDYSSRLMWACSELRQKSLLNDLIQALPANPYENDDLNLIARFLKIHRAVRATTE